METCAAEFVVDIIQKLCYKANMLSRGLEQRISEYKSRLQELEKKRKRLEEEIVTIKKYLDLAKPLHRVEAHKAKLANLSNQVITDEKAARPLPVMDVTDRSRAISLKRDTRFRKVSPNTFQTLKDTLIEAV